MARGWSVCPICDQWLTNCRCGVKKVAIKGDPFRREDGQLSDNQKATMDATKVVYENLWSALNILEADTGLSRDISLAKTHLQESCMWAVRHITKMPGQE